MRPLIFSVLILLLILGFLIWKYCCRKKKATDKVAPASFTFVEEIETFEKKKEEKDFHSNSKYEDSGRSSICEMIQNFSDRLDRNEFSDKKNSYTSEFLIHHSGTNGYFDNIEEEDLSSDDGKFIYAKEESGRVENIEETASSQRSRSFDGSNRSHFVDTSQGSHFEDTIQRSAFEDKSLRKHYDLSQKSHFEETSQLSKTAETSWRSHFEDTSQKSQVEGTSHGTNDGLKLKNGNMINK